MIGQARECILTRSKTSLNGIDGEISWELVERITTAMTFVCEALMAVLLPAGQS